MKSKAYYKVIFQVTQIVFIARDINVEKNSICVYFLYNSGVFVTRVLHSNSGFFLVYEWGKPKSIL